MECAVTSPSSLSSPPRASPRKCVIPTEGFTPKMCHPDRGPHPENVSSRPRASARVEGPAFEVFGCLLRPGPRKDPTSRNVHNIYSVFIPMLIRENVPLAPLTTLAVGGPARYFAEARNEADVLEAAEFARSRGLPLFVLGGGSNLVVADAGFVGLVLKVGITDLAQSTASHGQVTFIAGAGYDWDTLVAQTVEAGCAGLECLSGIPGTVGGTPVQNVGAYGQEVSGTIQEVRVLDLRSREITTLSNVQCGFAYRSSIFNTAESVVISRDRRSSTRTSWIVPETS